MATREEKIAFIQAQMSKQDSSQPKTREEKIAFIQEKMNEPQASDEGGFFSDLGNAALEKVVAAGQFVDSYTGAPLRAGIREAQEGRSPLPAMASQFGEDPSNAPTGKEIAQRAGVPNTSLSQLAPSMFTDNDKEAEQWLKFKRGGAADISASGAAGLGLDLAADPTNLVGGGVISKGARLGGEAVRAVAKGTKAVANPILDKASDVLRTATIKGGSTMTGVAEKNIATYIDKTDEVEKLISKHGGDMSLAADELREGLQKAIQTKIGSLNADVRKAIQSAPDGSAASNEAIVKALEHVKSGINSNLYPGSISEIDGLIDKVKALSPEQQSLSSLGTATRSGKIDASAANEAKRFLQDQAKGSYIKNGQLFTSSQEASRAAKAGAREARKIEMGLAPGTITPNKELARLHRYQENVNRNLIAPGKTESALLGAGSGANARNAKNLRDIGDMTGFDALGEAEKLSAAKAFAEPGYLPVDPTGKSLTRMAVAGTVGSLSLGPVLGPALGIAATSPQVLKQAIKTGKASKELISKLAGGTASLSDEALERAIKAAGTKEGQAIIRTFEKAAKQSHIQDYNKIADEKGSPSTRPLKGQEKWANDGFEKLQKSGQDLSKIKGALLSSPKGKKLLIAASDLKPGTKAFEKISLQIEKEFGGKN